MGANFPASPFFHGATKARWPRAAPTPLASGSRAQGCGLHSCHRFKMGAYASMRRSRRNGQLRRTSSTRLRIALHQQNFFLVRGSLGQNLPEGIANERMPQNSSPFSGPLRSRRGSRTQQTRHSRWHVNVEWSARHRAAPRRIPVLRRMPADRRGIKKECSPARLERRAPSGYH